MPTFLTPAYGLVRGHRGVGSLFPPRGRELHPHVKQFRRLRVRHVLASSCIACVSRQLVAPKSHVGLCSEGVLNSWPNSVLQRTRPTPHCPALRAYPGCGCTRVFLRHPYAGSSGLPPGLAGGISGARICHSVSLRSVG